MNKYMMLLAAAGLLVSTSAIVKADDHAEHAADVAIEAPAMTEATLKDGTKVSIEGDAVFVVAADGTKTSAPDGTHTLADDTTVTTKDGMIVHE